jgi:hypothetical protein
VCVCLFLVVTSLPVLGDETKDDEIAPARFRVRRCAVAWLLACLYVSTGFIERGVGGWRGLSSFRWVGSGALERTCLPYRRPFTFAFDEARFPLPRPAFAVDRVTWRHVSHQLLC